MIIDCPFCEGDEFGCCACDHSGKIDTSETDLTFDEFRTLAEAARSGEGEG